MAEITIKDYKIHTLQFDYIKYSQLLYNFELHINRCLDMNIININDKNKYFKKIVELLHNMNNIYNICIIEINKENDCRNINNILNLNLYSLDDIRTFINLQKILNLVNNNIGLYNEFFIEIKKDILKEISSNIGFYNIQDAYLLLIGDSYDKFLSKKNMYEIIFYDKIFVSIGFNLFKNENLENLEYFEIVKKDIENDVIFDNGVEIILLINTKKIHLCGFLMNDSLNIINKTSQICNNSIFQKKKIIEKALVNKNINQNFAKSYLRNATFANIITLSTDDFLIQLQTDYEQYVKLTKMSIINLMNEFKDVKLNKSNIKNMYNIIKLLLLFGSDDDINVAGLLFGITKEKKNSISKTISDTIYNNLSHTCQLKLKKSSINIKNELEKIKSFINEETDIKKQIAICKNMPAYVKKYCVEKAEEMKSVNTEYYKQLLFIKTLLNFPWTTDGESPEKEDLFFSNLKNDNNKSKIFLDSVVSNLNNKVYGHNECKQTIKELIGKWISNPSSSGTAIGFVGPPGVGKTLIAKAIGESLNIPFVQITLGGQNDGELLYGHGYTYAGAQPGLIVKKMVEAGNARCIMYFDELDKACKKYDNNEIYNILIHLIDPNTNKEFQDRFFQGITFPMDKVLFVFSYNDSSLIDNILMDRIEEIEIKPFKLIDKRAIVNNFILKEMVSLVGFPKGSVVIENDEIDFIIEQYTNEAGVRELKRKFEKIFLKLNIDKIYKNNIFANNIIELSDTNPIKLDKETIKLYLGKENTQIQTVHLIDTVGVVNGLYATDSGKGGILPIQIFNNYVGENDKFTLKLTGSQRKIMTESVKASYTTAIHLVSEKIRTNFIKNNPFGFHIHTPSAAVPKDGPSAGAAFTTAFVSRILNKKIKHNIAMTGEIELTGKVSKIGGLTYKLNGAKKAGVKLVFIPLENKDDVDLIIKDCDDLFCDDFKYKLVDNILEILEDALIDFDKSDF